MRIRLCPTLLALCGLAALSAEETPTPPPPTLVQTGGDGELVIKATRTTGEDQIQPYAVYAVDEQDRWQDLTRTAIDSLNHAPGVVVQRTANNQASPFIRGLTGEQTLLLFDGIRYNHAAMRPGPNQYAAVLPQEALGDIDVLLGSSSAVTGSDGLTGALDFRLAPAGRDASRPCEPWVRGTWGSATGTTGSAGVDGRWEGLAYSAEVGIGRYGDLIGGKDTGRRLRQDDLPIRDLTWAQLGLNANTMQALGFTGPPINSFSPAFDTSLAWPQPATDRIPNTGYDQWSAGARVAWEGWEHQRFEMAAGTVQQDDAPRPDGYKANSGGSDRISRFYPMQDFSYVHGTWITRRPEGEVLDHAEVRAWWHRHDEAEVRERIRNGTGYRQENKEDRIDVFGSEAGVGIRPFAGNVLSVGGTAIEETTRNRFSEFRSANLNPYEAVPFDWETWRHRTTLPDGAEYQTQACWVQDEYQVCQALTLTGSVRNTRNAWEADTWGRTGYDFYSDFWFFDTMLPGAVMDQINAGGVKSAVIKGDTDNLSWSARAAVTVAEGVVVYGGYGQGFRAPNLTNLFGSTDRGSSGNDINGNPFLAPELSRTVDGGVRWEHGDDRLAFSLFHTEVDDLIQPVGVDVDGDLIVDFERYQNAQDGELHGGEVSVDWGLPCPWWSTDHRLAVVGTGGWVRGTVNVPQALTGIVEREYISRANTTYGQAGLKYRYRRGPWGWLRVRFADRYDHTAPADAGDARLSLPGVGTATGELAGWAVLDLLGGYETEDGRIKIAGGVENLFNRSYREAGSGTDGAGTNFVVSVEWRPGGGP